MIDLREWPLHDITPENLSRYLKDSQPTDDILVTPDQHRHLFTQLPIEQQKALRATHSEHYDTTIALGIEGHVVYVSRANTTEENNLRKNIENSEDIKEKENEEEAKE